MSPASRQNDRGWAGLSPKGQRLRRPFCFLATAGRARVMCASAPEWFGIGRFVGNPSQVPIRNGCRDAPTQFRPF